MKKVIKVLTVSCLMAAFAGSMPAYADLETSPHQVTLVMAQEDYSNIAVSQVTDYVNIREEANTGSKIVGKIYNNCAAAILETVDGEDGQWYRIQSGTVNGFIKAQYFITGAEAEKLAQTIGREFVTVNADALRLREQPDLNSRTLTLLSDGARYVVQGEDGDFFKVEVDADMIGYIAKSYCKTEVEFDQAVSLEEEQQKLAEEAERKRDAENAMAALEQAKLVEARENAAAGNSAAGTSGNQGAAGNAGTAGNAGAVGNSGNAGTSGGTGTAGSGELIIEANPVQSDNSEKTTAPQLTAPQDNGAAGTSSAAGTSGSSSEAGSSGTTGTSGTTGSPVVAESPVSSGSGSASGVVSSTPGSAAVVTATRTAIVAYARQFLGNPYVYGGTSLTDGADCSGFTQGVFAHFGITTGRSSRDQAEKGRTIAVSAAQPGDLLFYANGDYINHVAIYIGNGQVIHASNPTTGICLAPYNYRTPYKAVTFLD